MGTNAQRKLQARNRVSCILPGLVWPGSVGTSLQNLELPGLAAILGRSRLEKLPAEPYAAWLSRQFGAENLPWGPLRCAGEDLPGEANANTLCADPVSLAFARDALILKGPRELALQPDEISALIATLNTELADTGSFLAASPERWYLQPTQPAGVRFQPLADVLGRPVALFQPEGDDAARWARLANEIQILLHNHPVNRAREEHGQPLVNALWFWGEGSATSALRAPADTLIGDDPMLRGLAKTCQTPWLSRTAAGKGVGGHSWWLNTELQQAALAGDFMAWLAALQRLDAELLQPLWHAWRSGQLAELQLIAPSDKTLLQALLGKPHRLAFWRKPLPAAKLGAVLQPPSKNV